ncbi:MAG: WG repeat-containing protein, partial [Candidatus Methanosuratincola sp.]
KVGEGWGYIDTRGSEVIPPDFDAAASFSEGLAAVGFGGVVGYIDRSGRLVIEPRFKMGYYFTEGVALVELEGGGWGYIDRSGSFIWVSEAQSVAGASASISLGKGNDP